MDKKTLALIQGDPAGIGPELLVKLLMDPAIREAANLIVVGDPRILARGEQQVGIDIPNLRQIDAEDPLKITKGEVLHLNIARRNGRCPDERCVGRRRHRVNQRAEKSA